MKALGIDDTRRPLAVAGIALVVAFFGPWLELAHVSGWDLATAGPGWTRHLLWLAPLGGAALAHAALGGASRARALALLLGGAIVAVAAHDLGRGLVEQLRYGAWLTVFGAIVALATGLLGGDRPWSLVGGAMVLAGFFLPWLGADPHALSGYDLARLPAAPPLPSPKWLYLVPLLGVMAALSAFTARGRLMSALAGAGILGVLTFLYVRTLDATLGWGLWLTVAAGVTALVAGVAARRT